MDNDDGHPANADGLSSDDGAVNVSTLRASIPDAAFRDAILLEVAGWVEESDIVVLTGIMAKRKRVREDAELRIKTSDEVRQRIANMIRGRMKNKVGDPVEFIKDVKDGRYDRHHTAFDIREAIALADKGLLRVDVITQIAGDWSNVVGGQTEYRFTVTKDGEEFLAKAMEARRAETLGSVHDSAVAKPFAQGAE